MVFITLQFHFVLCGFGAMWCKERERWEESLGLGQSGAGCLAQDQILKVSTKAHGTNLSQLQPSCSGGGSMLMEDVHPTPRKQSSDQTSSGNAAHLM